MKAMTFTFMAAIIIAIIVIAFLIWFTISILGSGETTGANIAQNVKDVFPFI